MNTKRIFLTFLATSLVFTSMIGGVSTTQAAEITGTLNSRGGSSTTPIPNVANNNLGGHEASSQIMGQVQAPSPARSWNWNTFFIIAVPAMAVLDAIMIGIYLAKKRKYSQPKQNTF